MDYYRIQVPRSLTISENEELALAECIPTGVTWHSDGTKRYPPSILYLVGRSSPVFCHDTAIVTGVDVIYHSKQEKRYKLSNYEMPDQFGLLALNSNFNS